jgi:UDP-glucose 4-epimerase
MKIMVTGVAGLVGSHISKALHDHTVTGIDSLIGGYVDNIPKEVLFIEKDCADLVKKDLEGVDIVIHAACTPHEGLSVFSPNFITKNTFGASMAVLTASIQAGVKKFIYLSSMARYGEQEIPFKEDMEPRPQDPYGISKVAFEQVLKTLANIHGFSYSIIVPHNIVGSGQVYTDPYRNVAGIMINRMLQGKQPIIYGDGSQMRCFSDIRDVVDPLLKVVTTDVADGEVINVGPDSTFITINELAKAIADLLDFSLDPIYLADRPSEVKLANCSADKARLLLGYSPKYSLEETLQSMIDWVSTRGVKPFNFNLPLELVSDLTPKTWVDPSIFNS